ncbi:MAG: T9SS type A sorting domain-containing protein, partial [Bacteroidota bacterium]|nr:T9SS type A sorting domain-containing protein [Bacteroidota bacterium]
VPETTGANKGPQEVDLKPFFDKGWEDVYMTFTDGIPTDGWGPALYKVSLSVIKNITSDVKTVSSNIPHTFAVEQNYPNPFNPETAIRYAIPKSGKITLSIYDILGREVRTLVNDIQNAGTYQVTWKGDNNFGEKVSSGIYFYRVSFDNQQQICKKMVMLK